MEIVTKSLLHIGGKFKLNRFAAFLRKTNVLRQKTHEYFTLTLYYISLLHDPDF